MDSQIVCLLCGTSNTSHSRYCWNCGHILRRETSKSLNEILQDKVKRAVANRSMLGTSLRNDEGKLRVFICHSSGDKPIVRKLFDRLNSEKNVEPWIDDEKLLPGEDWDYEIKKAVRESMLCWSVCRINL